MYGEKKKIRLLLLLRLRLRLRYRLLRYHLCILCIPKWKEKIIVECFERFKISIFFFSSLFDSIRFCLLSKFFFFYPLFRQFCSVHFDASDEIRFTNQILELKKNLRFLFSPHKKIFFEDCWSSEREKRRWSTNTPNKISKFGNILWMKYCPISMMLIHEWNESLNYQFWDWFFSLCSFYLIFFLLSNLDQISHRSDSYTLV